MLPSGGEPHPADLSLRARDGRLRHDDDRFLREAGVKVYANLFGDTLGTSGSPGATYIGMERSNVQNVVTGLLGHAPNAGTC